VYLSEVGTAGSGDEIDYGTILPNEIGHPRESPRLFFYPYDPNPGIIFLINTPNGTYTQTVLAEKFGDKWLWACRLYKYPIKEPIRVWAAPGFPKEVLNGD
jgi:hypothetical protein